VGFGGDAGAAETDAGERPKARARGDAARPGPTTGAVLTPECHSDLMRGTSIGSGKGGGGDTRGAAVGDGVGARCRAGNVADAGAGRDAMEGGCGGPQDKGVAGDGCCCAAAGARTC
jgi:hypothetical protein